MRPEHRNMRQGEERVTDCFELSATNPECVCAIRSRSDWSQKKHRESSNVMVWTTTRRERLELRVELDFMWGLNRPEQNLNDQIACDWEVKWNEWDRSQILGNYDKNIRLHCTRTQISESREDLQYNTINTSTNDQKESKCNLHDKTSKMYSTRREDKLKSLYTITYKRHYIYE